ncbi:MAG TPA: ATP phosphoribosyltransferase regulatory subunit, partial [Rubrivivax sp.]|nr:ATP phosphoribosyltransferase regulatory subunit [Rubrivivax sp.]
AKHLRTAFPALQIGFDLADMSGYAYYSGLRFAIYGAGSSEALARGGRYDEVGAVFGRNRPAVGFSLDLKSLARGLDQQAVPPAPAPKGIRAPWGEDPGLRAAVRSLREAGETVLALLPGHELETQALDIDRELIASGGRWVVQSVGAAKHTS